jgi:HAD superfamily hydrolase (TIGR01450 family)
LINFTFNFLQLFIAGLGYNTGLENIITSSSVTAEYLFQKLNKGNLTLDGERVDETPIKVFMVGNPALKEELELKGFEVLYIRDDEPVGLDEKAFHEQQETLDKDVKAVVVGIDYSFTYRKLAIGGLYMQTNCLYVATNPDNANRITGGGMYPEPGVLIAAYKSVCGLDPIICGKPSHIIVEHVSKHLNSSDPSKVLMIGDRLDTDIAFANKAMFASCLVLSGVTSPDEAQEQIEDLLNLTQTPTFVEESLWELVSHLQPTMRKSQKNPPEESSPRGKDEE